MRTRSDKLLVTHPRSDLMALRPTVPAAPPISSTIPRTITAFRPHEEGSHTNEWTSGKRRTNNRSPWRAAMPSRTVRDALEWATRRRTVGFVNLTTLIMLFAQTVMLMTSGPSGLISRSVCELPQPFRDAVRATSSGPVLSAPHNPRQLPGYVATRNATFRDRYPSVSVQGAGTFDAVFALSASRCPERWTRFRTLATSAGLTATRWPVVDARGLSLDSPPLPLSPGVKVPVNRAERAMFRRRLAYLDAQRRLWEHVIHTRKQRVLVLDDAVFPTKKFLHEAPALLSAVDVASVARAHPWHVLLLRRAWTGINEEVWVRGGRAAGFLRDVTVAKKGSAVGLGAYVLTLDGAKKLSATVRRFRAGADLELGMLMREVGINVLSACRGGKGMWCPDVVGEIDIPQLVNRMECVWRQLDEQTSAATLSGPTQPHRRRAR